MLQFFRKYQKYFYVLITIVIVISFSFFGTYSTLPSEVTEDPIVFKSVNGSSIKRSEVESLALFIGTDSFDKAYFYGMWGPNFLNNGVIAKDFLATGLAKELIQQYAPLLKEDFVQRHEKEKRYTLYTHPEAKFISTASAWEYFIPQKKTHYYKLIQAQNPQDQEAVAARISLYLDERLFPSPSLAQVLKYQQKQYNWIKPDPTIDQADFSLFGYHTLEDWFGAKFIRLVSEFIINSAEIAGQRGYKVSDAEVLADLVQNAEASFNQNVKNFNLGVANSQDYLNEQLRRFGMDKRQAVKVWRQVMLFRRLFHDMGNSVLVSPFTFEEFNAYANESVKGKLYQLPEALQIGNFKDLQKLEVYLKAISKTDKNNPLNLPTIFLPISEIEKKHPELVQKNYTLEVAHVDKNNLQNRISVKKMWNWQVLEPNWKLLVKEFPNLGVNPAKNEEERFAKLESLDDRTHAKIDAYSRDRIIESHPDWIEEALDKAKLQQMNVSLSKKGGRLPFEGITNREELIGLLDNAPLKEQSEKLSIFSQNRQNFYRIQVIDRTNNQKVMTFAEANQSGVLNRLLDIELNNYYKKNSDLFPEEFSQAKEKVAEKLFSPLLAAIKKENKGVIFTNNDTIAPFRFQKYMSQIVEKIKNNPDVEKEWILTDDTTPSFKNQWKLIKTPLSVKRSTGKETFNKDLMFSLAPGSWSSVNTLPNGDLHFYYISEKVAGVGETLLEQISEAHDLLSNDAQQTLMKQVLGIICEKNAISLSYTQATIE